MGQKVCTHQVVLMFQILFFWNHELLASNSLPVRSRLKLIGTSWHPTRTDSRLSPFVSLLALVMRSSGRSQALLHGAKHTHLAQKSEKLNEDAGKGRAIAGQPLPHANKASQQINDSMFLAEGREFLTWACRAVGQARGGGLPGVRMLRMGMCAAGWGERDGRVEQNEH